MSNDSLKEIDGLLDQIEAKVATMMAKPELVGTTLPITTKICHKIDSSELATWVAKQLGLRYLEITEADNDTDHDFDTNTRHTPRINWEREMESINETLDKAKERGNIPIWEVRNLLNYFADAGLILEGNYIVSVSW